MLRVTKQRRQDPAATSTDAPPRTRHKPRRAKTGFEASDTRDLGTGESRATQKGRKPTPAPLVLPARVPCAGGFSAPKLICWDYNGTISGYQGTRSGMAVTVQELVRHGAYNVLTTSVGAGHVRGELRAEGIELDAYLGGSEVRNRSFNKEYGLAVRGARLSAADTAAHMLVIGDSPSDAPADVTCVFIQNDHHTPAEAILLLARELDVLGEGSFLEGLRKLRPDESGRAHLGPISLRVGTADAGDGHEVPAIFDVELSREPKAYKRLLADTASPALATARRLAVTTLADAPTGGAKLTQLQRVLAKAPELAADVAQRMKDDAVASERRGLAIVQAAERLPTTSYGLSSRRAELTALAADPSPSVLAALRALVPELEAQQLVKDAKTQAETEPGPSGLSTAECGRLLDSVLDLQRKLPLGKDRLDPLEWLPLFGAGLLRRVTKRAKKGELKPKHADKLHARLAAWATSPRADMAEPLDALRTALQAGLPKDRAIDTRAFVAELRALVDEAKALDVAAEIDRLVAPPR